MVEARIEREVMMSTPEFQARMQAAQLDDQRRFHGGYVYLIEMQLDGKCYAYKIGLSHNPSMRLADLQVSNPARLVLVCSITGGLRVEQELHKQFSHLSMRGEWFKPEIEILEEFQKRGAAIAA